MTSQLPPWWGKNNKKAQRDIRKREIDRAKDLGARVQPGSGSTYRRSGDFIDDTFLTESKETSKSSFSLKLELWEKIKKEAALMGRAPRMEIVFLESDTRLMITEI